MGWNCHSRGLKTCRSLLSSSRKSMPYLVRVTRSIGLGPILVIQPFFILDLDGTTETDAYPLYARDPSRERAATEPAHTRASTPTPPLLNSANQPLTLEPDRLPSLFYGLLLSFQSSLLWDYLVRED